MQVLALNNDEGTVKSVPFLCGGGYKVNLPCGKELMKNRIRSP